MELLQPLTYTCPYCGESGDTLVDTSLPSQCYIEDCPVCCRPITLELSCTPGEVAAVSLRREDDG
jgi:hypothetical protein